MSVRFSLPPEGTPLPHPGTPSDGSNPLTAPLVSDGVPPPITSSSKGKKPESAAPPCHDWMLVGGGCHYTPSRDLFSEYLPVERMVRHRQPCGTFWTYVAGIGTVRIIVRTNHNEPDKRGLLTLENTLHIPVAKCSGFNKNLYHRKHDGLASDTYGENAQRQTVWLSITHAGHRRLRRIGDLAPTTGFVEGRTYNLDCPISEYDVQAAMAKPQTELERRIAGGEGFEDDGDTTEEEAPAPMGIGMSGSCHHDHELLPRNYGIFTV